MSGGHFDYNQWRIYEIADQLEDYITKLGFNTNSCSWMFAEDIEVFKHKGILK